MWQRQDPNIGFLWVTGACTAKAEVVCVQQSAETPLQWGKLSRFTDWEYKIIFWQNIPFSFHFSHFQVYEKR